MTFRAILLVFLVGCSDASMVSVPSVACRWQTVKAYTAPDDKCMVVIPLDPSSALTLQEDACEARPCVWLNPGETAYSVTDAASFDVTADVHFGLGPCNGKDLIAFTPPECRP